MDGDVITGLARSMPKLKTLELGGPPRRKIPTGVTAKGLVVLAHHCPDLSTPILHFQVAGLSAPPTISGMAPNTTLTDLEVGEIPGGVVGGGCSDSNPHFHPYNRRQLPR